jgi:hypothetical protein
MPHLFSYVVLGWAACALLGGWGYFRRYQVSRPPIGVLNLKDITLMVIFILLAPFLYLVLPLWAAWGLLGLSALGVLSATWEPVLHARWATWLVVLAGLSADSGAAFLFGRSSIGFLAVNNTLLLLVIVGISNLWAQSGMKARDVVLLAAVLTVYDVLATSALPLTSDLFTRLAGLPLAPIIAWGSGSSVVGIGLGDLLLATVFPLVMRKAFDRAAGITAIVLALLAVGLLLALPLPGVFPVMVVLGPLMVVQYFYWRRRRGRERTMWQYLQQEPLRLHGIGSPPKPARELTDQAVVHRREPAQQRRSPSR